MNDSDNSELNQMSFNCIVRNIKVSASRPKGFFSCKNMGKYFLTEHQLPRLKRFRNGTIPDFSPKIFGMNTIVFFLWEYFKVFNSVVMAYVVFMMNNISPGYFSKMFFPANAMQISLPKLDISAFIKKSFPRPVFSGANIAKPFNVLFPAVCNLRNIKTNWTHSFYYVLHTASNGQVCIILE